MIVLAIDPGPVQSAWLVLGDHAPRGFATWRNEELVDAIYAGKFSREIETVVIEKVESYGMAVGAEVFETVFWSGRFAEAATRQLLEVQRIGRLKVKTTICHDSRAKDSNIRAALIDRFGGSTAIGKKATPGPLYGVAGDVWAALAVACTWSDLRA